MALNTYFDFAKNDDDFFQSAFNSNQIWNSMASMAQNSCEKYLKHLIEYYQKPETKDEFDQKEKALKAHSLRKLLKHLEDEMGISVPSQVENSMLVINGYYYSTRYPGDDSITVNKKDLIQCKKAIDECREFVKNVIVDKEILHSEHDILKMFSSRKIPECLKEQILRASYNEIKWSEVSGSVMQNIRERYPAFCNDFCSDK